MLANTILPDINEQCRKILDDFDGITDLIDKSLVIPELHKKIDIFFYIENKLNAKLLCRQLVNSPNPDLMLFKELIAIHVNVKSKWQEDFRYMVSPESLHAHFTDSQRALRFEGEEKSVIIL